MVLDMNDATNTTLSHVPVIAYSVGIIAGYEARADATRPDSPIVQYPPTYTATATVDGRPTLFSPDALGTEEAAHEDGRGMVARLRREYGLDPVPVPAYEAMMAEERSGETPRRIS